MTATVTEDAELGFCLAGALDLLLQERPELCQQLLAILAERMAKIKSCKGNAGQREAAIAAIRTGLSTSSEMF
jgi:CRP-like cAMP-binding protein